MRRLVVPDTITDGDPCVQVHASFELPDALARVPEQAGIWRDGGLCAMDGVGEFVGCLLPVRLEGGGTVTFSTWMSVPVGHLAPARRVWGTPSYGGLCLGGTLANVLGPWGAELLGAPVRAEVRDPAQLPYVTGSDHPLAARVLAETWDRDTVLSSLEFPLPVPVRHRLDEHWSIERSAGLVSRVVRGRQRFIGTGRQVLISSYPTDPGASAEEVLCTVTAGATPHGEPITERDAGATHIRYAMNSVADVQGVPQYELYGFTIGPGGFLETVCIHEDPADAAWALAVWRSIRRHS
jgi:hypothetical protein